MLVSGELSIVVTQHGQTRTVGHVHRGEVFGELALLCGERRSATVLAARDSWMARFDNQLLEEAVLTRNDALRALLRITAERLSAQGRAVAHSARVMAVLQRDAGVDMDQFLRGLCAALGNRGRVVTPETLHAEGVISDVRRLPPQHPAGCASKAGSIRGARNSIGCCSWHRTATPHGPVQPWRSRTRCC